MIRKTVAALAVVSCLPIAASAQDWSGFYGGLEAGISKPSSGFADDNKTMYGGFAGYNYDFGGSVAGIELGYSNPEIGLSSGGQLENQLKVKARYGFALGEQGLLYGTAGYLRSKVSTGGDAEGYLVGVGYDHKLSDHMFVGGELTHNRYETIPGGGEAIANQASLRVGFQF